MAGGWGSFSSPVPQGPISIPSAIIFPQGRLQRQGRKLSNTPQGGVHVNDANLGKRTGSDTAVATGVSALNLGQFIGLSNNKGGVRVGQLNANQFQGGVESVFQGRDAISEPVILPSPSNQQVWKIS